MHAARTTVVSGLI